MTALKAVLISIYIFKKKTELWIKDFRLYPGLTRECILRIAKMQQISYLKL